MRRAGALVACLGILTGCVATRWDAERWALERPELAGRDLGRLGDATPVPLAADDVLHLFWCRWPLGRALRVSFPPDASDPERALLLRALDAWQRALPELRFALVAGEGELRLRFGDTRAEGAHAAVDCEVEAPFDGDGALRAELVHAEVVLRREERDPFGHPIALRPEELLASAVHEIGHALGHAGHARAGGSVMVRDHDRLRRIGRRLLRGGRLEEPALNALYALPSGTRIARRRLPVGATAAVDALAQRARARGLERATLRVGDGAARVAWGGDPTFAYLLKDPGSIIGKDWIFSENLVIEGSPAAPR